MEAYSGPAESVSRAFSMTKDESSKDKKKFSVPVDVWERDSMDAMCFFFKADAQFEKMATPPVVMLEAEALKAG